MLQGNRVSVNDLIRVRAKVQGLMLPRHQAHYFTGRTRSSILGKGMEYEESRKYTPGDDARLIDWRVTARTGIAHTKIFREDRQRNVFICVDLTATMHFGTQVAFKSVVAMEAASMLAWSSVSHGDNVCTIAITDAEFKKTSVTSNARGLIRHFSMLANLSEQYESNSQRSVKLSDLYTWLSRKANPGDMIFILSDFFSLTEQDLVPFEILSQRRLLAACWILDRIEIEALPSGNYPVTDRVNFSILNLPTNSSRVHLQSILDSRNQTVEKLLQRLKASVLRLQPGDDVSKKLFEAYQKTSKLKTRFARNQISRTSKFRLTEAG